MSLPKPLFPWLYTKPLPPASYTKLADPVARDRASERVRTRQTLSPCCSSAQPIPRLSISQSPHKPPNHTSTPELFPKTTISSRTLLNPCARVSPTQETLTTPMQEFHASHVLALRERSCRRRLLRVTMRGVRGVRGVQLSSASPRCSSQDYCGGFSCRPGRQSLDLPTLLGGQLYYHSACGRRVCVCVRNVDCMCRTSAWRHGTS